MHDFVIYSLGKLTKQRVLRKLAIESGKCNLIVIDPGIPILIICFIIIIIL